MKRSLFVAVVLALFAFPISGFAQMAIKFRGSDGWGLGSRYEQIFNNYNIQTVYGKITQIDTISPFNEMSFGIQISMTNGSEETPVHLGPAWFLLHQDMKLSIGDKIEVKGSRVAFDGKPTIMAVELKYKDKVLVLRDEDGIPSWCIWRKK